MSQQQTFYNLPYTMFPTTKIQLQIEGRVITSKYKECLRTAYLTQNMYLNKFNWEDGTLDNKLSHSDRQKIQKFNIRRLHTNNRRHMFRESTSEYCTFCDNIIETNEHILHCRTVQSSERPQKRNGNYNTPDEIKIKTAITAALHCW